MMRRASHCFVVLLAPLKRVIRSKAFVFLMLAPVVRTASARAQGLSAVSARKWDVSIWAAGATGEENSNSFSEAQLLMAGVFVGRITGEIGTGWLRGRFEYGADFVPIFAQFTPQRISGIAFDPVLLRWDSSRHRGRVSPVVELGGGALHTRGNFPIGDTSTFNFIARGGGGILIATRPTQALELTCRWWHISNANLGIENPEFNGIQFSLGWHWFK